MKNLNKILLKENEIISDEIIQNARIAYSNRQVLISKLNNLGLTVNSVTDWTEQVENHFKQGFSNAPIKFNIDALGITDQYLEVEAFYLKNQYQMRFVPVTDEQIEEIKESQRVYATTESQIEAIELFNTIKDNLLKLKDLGVVLDLNKTYLISRVLIGDDRLSPALTVEPTALCQTVLNLK